MKASSFCALLLALSAAPAVAQEAPAPLPLQQVDSLARVRLTQHFVEPRRLVGTLVAVDSEDVVVERGTERVTVPLVYVRRMEVSRGRMTAGHGAWRGARVGFLAGAGMSALLIAAAHASEGSSCGDCFITASTAAVVVSLPLTGVSTFAGAAVGASRPGDRWERVPLPPQPEQP